MRAGSNFLFSSNYQGHPHFINRAYKRPVCRSTGIPGTLDNKLQGKYQRQLLLTLPLDCRAETFLIVYSPQPQKMAAPWRSRETRKGGYWWMELLSSRIPVYKSKREQHSSTTMIDQAKIYKVETGSNTHRHQHFHDRIWQYCAGAPTFKLSKSGGLLNPGSDHTVQILLLRPYWGNIPLCSYPPPSIQGTWMITSSSPHLTASGVGNSLQFYTTSVAVWACQ